MNEEQKAWIEKIKALITTAEGPDSTVAGEQSAYETLVDGLQAALDTCPEP